MTDGQAEFTTSGNKEESINESQAPPDQALRALVEHRKELALGIERDNAGDPGFRKRVETITAENAELRKASTLGLMSPEEYDRLLAVEQAELERRGGVDFLTGISNGYRFRRDSERILSSAKRSGSPVSVIKLDIDDFKAVNDTPGQGHDVGDAVLFHLAAYVQAHLRDGIDAFGRLSSGGDEFAITAPGMNTEDALVFIERLKQDLSSNITKAVRDMGLNLGQNVTISIGVANTSLLNGDYSYRRLMTAADNALYAAKHTGKGAGKNQIEIYKPNINSISPAHS